jgi:hypothetical protein
MQRTNHLPSVPAALCQAMTDTMVKFASSLEVLVTKHQSCDGCVWNEGCAQIEGKTMNAKEPIKGGRMMHETMAAVHKQNPWSLLSAQSI